MKDIDVLQAMQEYLPTYVEEHYPKGTKERGAVTVHIIEFLLDYRNKKWKII
jgi:hypothetical protein